MLEISKVSWSNFLSFGDYVSTVDLTEIKECSITGVIEDDNGNVVHGKSNGAGKSNIIAAIQWGLFDRTSHCAKPGNKIRNYFTKSDTWVKIVLNNGDSILRTRKVDGTTEVVFYLSGREECIVAETLGTMKAQQAKLAHAFDLDWDIFSKSVFFSCFDNPWMQMSDQKRKEVLEKLFKLDRLAYYAKSASVRAGDELTKLDAEKTAISTRLKFLSELKDQTEKQRNLAEIFESEKQRKLTEKWEYINVLDRNIDAIPGYDLKAIGREWAEYNKDLASVNSKVSELLKKKAGMQAVVAANEREIRTTNEFILNWQRKADKECLNCGQVVPKGHTEQKITPKLQELQELRDSIPKLTESITSIDNMISHVNMLMEAKKPKNSLSEATAQHNHKQAIIAQKNKVLEDIKSIEEETSPIVMSIEELKASMMRILEETKEHKKQSEIIENKILHLEYIRKGYSDRNKVKRIMMQDHIPFMNDRLKYYLDIMELDVKIQLTDSLGIESNYWGYDFQSNGEKRRTDVAMMFATFDTHEHLYGRQCNLLVLDEVDGQMDGQGLNSLVHIIKNDLSNRVGSIFVISHKQTLQNVFGSEITVRKRGNFSYLE